MTLAGRVRKSWRAWTDYQRFRMSGADASGLVVYSEGSGDWPHVGPVLDQLLRHGTGYAYCTSDECDPGLLVRHDAVRGYFVGTGTIRALLFRDLACRVLLTTLPDIGAFELKRSPRVRTLAYLFHSINSTHTVYRERAFEAYDAILCVGPHHVRELRREEELKGLPPRRRREHGSVKRDAIARSWASLRASGPGPDVRPLALVAPSWGDGSIAEDPDLLGRVVRGVCGASWACRLRLHPMTVRRRPRIVEDLRRTHRALRESGLFEVETDVNDDSSLRAARVMISDWSGAATEFAFALGRPVLFVDTPRKINNPSWRSFGLPGLEDEIRSEIGAVLPPEAVDGIGGVLASLAEGSRDRASRIEEARRRWIFNVGCAAEAGAGHVLSLLRAGDSAAADR